MKTAKSMRAFAAPSIFKNFFLICCFSFCFHGFSAPIEKGQEQSSDEETASFVKLKPEIYLTL